MIGFSGVNRSGTHESGWSHRAPGDFVEAKYRARWRELVVTAPDGEEVGAILTDDDGRRIWWASDIEGGGS